MVILVLAFTAHSCVISRWAWGLCISCLHSLYKSFCVWGQMDVGWPPLFRLHWLGATQRVSSSWSLAGCFRGKGRGARGKPASVCTWLSRLCSHHVCWCPNPMAEACPIAESRLKGRQRFGSIDAISLPHLPLPYSPTSPLYMDFTLQFRDCRFWGVILSQQFTLTLKDLKLYTFYQFT